MPPIFINGQEVVKRYVGTQEVVAAYVVAQQVFSSGFDPATIFPGKQGVWYDTSDFATMFTDTAGTTPVTAAGQNVRRINDKSGNGNDIIFNAGVPLAQDVDGAFYLQGNGANGATAAAVNLGAYDKISIVSAIQMSYGDAVFSFGSIVADAGSFEFGVQSTKKPLVYWRGSSGFCAKYHNVDLSPKVVFSTQVDFAGTDIATECPLFRINANDVATSAVNSNSGSGPLGNFVFKLLVGYGATFLGKFYGLVAVTGLLDAETNLSLETWMGDTAVIPVSSTVLPYQLVPTTFTDSLTPVDKTTYLETSAYAQVVIDTTATEIEVVSVSNIVALFPDLAEIGVYVDGVFNTTIQQGGDGTNTNRITLSAGSKRVSFVNGAQSQIWPIKGTFINTINANAAMTQAFPAATNRILVYGDSIAVGANAVATQQNAWAMQLRRYRTNKSTMIEAQGFRSLYDDAHDTTTRNAFVAKVVSANPEKLWISIGTNDYGIPMQSAANFGTNYAALLDALHTALPSLVIYCQTPIVRASEAANVYGDTLGNYRSQISTAVSTRTGYCTLVDGTTLVSTGDLQDGVHPTDAGHGIYYAAVKTALGI